MSKTVEKVFFLKKKQRLFYVKIKLFFHPFLSQECKRIQIRYEIAVHY
jgi:hypothetical protein